MAKKKANPHYRNSWEWLSQEYPEAISRVLEGKYAESPAHVEIHPHHSTTILCNNNCHSCTGSYYKGIKNTGIEVNRLIETIDSFKGKVNEVMYSGCCIEPLLYPDITETIKHIKDADIKFTLYSNFYYGNRPGLIDQLTAPNSEEDCIRISLDAGTNESYNHVHSPYDKNSFYKIKDNIKELLNAKKKKDLTTHVSVTYLMTNENSSKEELESTIQWAYMNEGINNLRFSTYQKPINREMPKSSIIDNKILRDRNNFLEDLKKEYKRNDFDLQIRYEPMLTGERPKTFDKCSAQGVFGVISYDGGVRTCTAMGAPKTPEEFQFGNINTEDFWDIWKNRKELRKIPLEKCADCTRAEYNLNSKIHEILSRPKPL